MSHNPRKILWVIGASIGLLLFLYVAALLSCQPGPLLSGFADLIRALAWPLVVCLLLLRFHAPVSDLIRRVTKIDFGGGSIELNRTIDEVFENSVAAAKAQPLERNPVSTEDITRAQKIERVATSDDLPRIHNRMLDLADDYDRLRSSMPYGGERTRAMSVVVAQMRTLGLVAFPLRGELAFSIQAGRRLAALIIAQIKPDITMVGWITSCVGPPESQFVQYHALNALLSTARNANSTQLDILEHAYEICKYTYEHTSQYERTDRHELIDSLSRELDRLRATAIKPAITPGS